MLVHHNAWCTTSLSLSHLCWNLQEKDALLFDHHLASADKTIVIGSRVGSQEVQRQQVVNDLDDLSDKKRPSDLFQTLVPGLANSELCLWTFLRTAQLPLIFLSLLVSLGWQDCFIAKSKDSAHVHVIRSSKQGHLRVSVTVWGDMAVFYQ